MSSKDKDSIGLIFLIVTVYVCCLIIQRCVM